jgi:hypothetical protein
MQVDTHSIPCSILTQRRLLHLTVFAQFQTIQTPLLRSILLRNESKEVTEVQSRLQFDELWNATYRLLFLSKPLQTGMA